MKLGVCYYPEQWPEACWPDDARRMCEMGISHVRIAEFAWALIEPRAGQWDWAWLDRAIACLSAEGLSVVLCTPTATPPKWLVDAYPEILPVNAAGNTRGFGSRRHYCFSSPVYRAHSSRITEAIARRYGTHPNVVAWQTDNEYGCHDTVLSYSHAARHAFRDWLRHRYETIDALNLAWGTRFWSQCYNDFTEIDAPVATVTEANPAHRLDWQRFASDEVVAFNREQVEILRAHSPGRDITHNFMGFFTGFNHHDVSRDLDVAAWDSYPLGFTQMFFHTAEEKTRYARVGDPDIPAFHHDLYRGMCCGQNARRWWVMEQQPGPVNWAHWNPAPLDGMVRLWTWQAFAHGAELVSYFRWRQAPFGQEQMHAGLLRPDRADAQGAVEARQVGEELAHLRSLGVTDAATAPRAVALVFDYDALWMQQIQPQGQDYNPVELHFRLYSALRQLGLDVDVVGPHEDLQAYRLVILPAQTHVSARLLQRLTNCNAQIVFAPRAGSKTEAFQIPDNLPPGPLQTLTGVRVSRVASLPPGYSESVAFVSEKRGTPAVRVTRWREEIELCGAEVEAHFTDGTGAVARHGRVRYIGAWLDEAGWQHVLSRAAQDAGLSIQALPTDLRIHRTDQLIVATNFSAAAIDWQPEEAAELLIGSTPIPPRDCAIWRASSGAAPI